jgi:hypothetical protein
MSPQALFLSTHDANCAESLVIMLGSDNERYDWLACGAFPGESQSINVALTATVPQDSATTPHHFPLTRPFPTSPKILGGMPDRHRLAACHAEMMQQTVSIPQFKSLATGGPR